MAHLRLRPGETAQQRYYSKPENRAKRAAQQKAQRARPEVRARYALRMREWRKAHPDRAYEIHRKAKGLPIPTRPRPLCCDLCRRACKPYLDHNHRTGVFRGWLCQQCNHVLGLIADNADTARRMAAYLDYGG